MVEILKSEFKQTKIGLGKGKTFTVSTKAKYVPPEYSVVCPAGHGWVKVDEQGRTRCCGAIVIREATYETVAKRFQIILDHNLGIFGLSVSEKDNIKIPVKIGHAFYFVPVKYFIEFSNILNHDKYESFFSNIKQVCHTAKL